MKITRRVGSHPHANGNTTSSSPGCPDIFELDSGEFAIIGRRATDKLKSLLPADASCGHDEDIVIIDRHVLIGAKSDIPEC